MDFIHQPDGALRLGDYLREHLGDRRWEEFRAAVAFVKRSGTQHIRAELARFDQRGSVRVSVGVDFFGTSQEGLSDFLQSVARGQVVVYHNPGSSTFHPKIYLFKNSREAHLVIGSGNLTEGGLFTNYESSLHSVLDLSDSKDATFLAEVENVLDRWSQPATGSCYRLTTELLNSLVASGLVKSEAQLAAIAQQAALTTPTPPGHTVEAGSRGTVVPLFTARRVPRAPRAVREAGRVREAGEAIAEALAEAIPIGGARATTSAAHGIPTSFVMTLQRTDVGVGQKRPGKARRSPEVFIPLAALDRHPNFWGFPKQFKSDKKWDTAHPRARRQGHGKLDRFNVSMRIGTIHQVNMFFNPDKKDLRLRSETLRSSGKIGDIIWIQRVDPSHGFEYDVQVAPQGSPRFNQLQTYCVEALRNSMKRFGYF